MKLTLAIFTVCVCLLGLTQALETAGGPLTIAWRQNCPSSGDCEAFAKQLEDNGFCKSYTFVENWIEWRSCDVLLCPDNKVGKEDLSKPFPDCCPKCE